MSSQDRVATLSLRWLGKPLTYFTKRDGRYPSQGYDTAIVSHGNWFEQINTSTSNSSVVGVKMLGLKKPCKALGLLITGSSATAELVRESAVVLTPLETSTHSFGIK